MIMALSYIAIWLTIYCMYLTHVPYILLSVPVSPPDNVTNTEISTTSLSFVWGEVPCGSRAGVVTGYRYKLVNVETGVETTGSTINMQVRLADLMSCTGYNFSVAGRTNVGTGPFSEPLRVTTAVDGKAIRCNLTKYPGSLLSNCTGLFRHNEETWSRSISLFDFYVTWLVSKMLHCKLS